MYIVADIGGTNARFAQVELAGGELQVIKAYRCSDFGSLEDAFTHYIQHNIQNNIQNNPAPPINAICAAVAGPITTDCIDLPNNPWTFSRSALQQSLGIPVMLINDFSAQALAIDAFSEAAVQWLGSARPAGNQVKAIMGPGTGLGVSALMPGGQPLPSEAGHIAFAPVTAHEVDLLKVLWQRYERVSIERLLSGMGLANLYWANCLLEGHAAEKSPESITEGALAGDRHCLAAMTDFFAILASVAGDLALMMGAEGGVYLSGGMLVKMKPFLKPEKFRQRFEDKGRFSSYCAKIPTAIVLEPYPGLLGCVQALK